jgi:hypothetical protein
MHIHVHVLHTIPQVAPPAQDPTKANAAGPQAGTELKAQLHVLRDVQQQLAQVRPDCAMACNVETTMYSCFMSSPHDQQSGGTYNLTAPAHCLAHRLLS